jgi:hypothetical protein
VAGVRFVPLAAEQPICESAVVTRPESGELATKAFTHALLNASERVSIAPAAAVPLVAA